MKPFSHRLLGPPIPTRLPCALDVADSARSQDGGVGPGTLHSSR